MSGYLPLNYEEINLSNSTHSPTTIKARNNKSFAYWQRSLFQRACSVINFDFPDEWEGSTRDFFYYCLFRYGYLVVFDSDDYGFTFQPCGFSGYNWYYQPTKCIVTNPALKKSLELEIHKDCEILKLTPDFMGIFDIIDYYAEKLSHLDNGLNMSLINSKFAMIFGGKNKQGVELIKKLMDKVNKGEPMVVFDTAIAQNPSTPDDPFPWSYWDRDVKKSYITTDLLQDFTTIINNFDSEVGIPCAPYQKKERMVSNEVDSRIIDSTSRSVVWRDCLVSCSQVINEHFGVNLNPTLRHDPDNVDFAEGGVEDE